MGTALTISADEWGPMKVLVVRDPSVGLEGIVVVDNVACGPSVGGIRMAPDVTVEEVARLARAMTFKNAAAGIPHGGGKAGIIADPKMDSASKENLVRAFARAIRDLNEYIPGPDMGTDETCMAWIHDEIGRSVGLPSVIGGIPLDEIGATGFGVAISAEVGQSFAGIELRGARVAIQGFGAVGQHAARFLIDRGANIVAVADSRGTLINEDGVEIFRLIEFKNEGNPVCHFPAGDAADRDSIIGVECDIWIPAARPDVLTADNVSDVKAKLVLQGANIPATLEAEAVMHRKGIISVPDFIANVGGVMCASVEYRGGSQAQAFAVIEEKVRENTRLVLERSKETGMTPRESAEELAKFRVRQAMEYRR